MLHSTQELFPNGFKTYFENSFKRNTMGTLKFSSSTIRNSQFTVEELGESIAQQYIDIVVKMMYPLLRNIKFSWLLPDDLEALRESVCSAVQHCLLNRNVFERLNSSSISTNTFSVNEDNTNWLLNKDMLGNYAWTTLRSTGIDEYKLVSDEDLGFFTETANGNYQLVGYISEDTMKELL